MIFLTLLFCQLMAQDLIVTSEGDSINCRITKEKHEFVYFTFRYDNETRSTLLPVSQIKSFEYDFFSDVEVPPEKIIGYRNYPRFRLVVQGGYSHTLGRIDENIDPELVDYFRELKSGYHLGAEFLYYFSDYFGFGLKTNLFRTKNEIGNIYVEDQDGNRRYGILSNDIKTSLVAPCFAVRLLGTNKRNAFLTDLSIGYMGYSNDLVLVDPYKLTGKTLGFVWDIGYELGISEYISLGVQFSIIDASLSEYERDDGNKVETIKLDQGKFESLCRMDISIGLRIILN